MSRRATTQASRQTRLAVAAPAVAMAVGVALGVAGGVAGGVSGGESGAVAGGVALGVPVGAAPGVPIGAAPGVPIGAAPGVPAGAPVGAAAGSASGTRAPVFDGPELDYQPSIVRVQPSGEMMIVFERLDSGTYLGDLHLTASDDGGASWSEPRPIVAGEGNERHPALVQLTSGSFALFYLFDALGEGAYRVHRATSVDGVDWVDQGAVDLGWASPGEINPAVIVEADGTLTMTYHRLSGPSYLARSQDDGETWDKLQTQVSSRSAALPRIAKREADGTYLVTFQVNPGDNNLDLWARLSSDPHDWSGPAIPVSVEVNSHDSQPIVLEDGTFVVFYAEQVGSAFDVHYRHSEDGLSWSRHVPVTESPDRYDTQPHPLLHSAPGHVVLAWAHQDGDQPYQDHDVWVDSDLELNLEDPMTTVHMPISAAGGPE